MKKLTVATLMMGLVGLLPLLSGCQTLSDTPGSNAVRVNQAMSTDMLQVPDDAENIMLLDRPVQLSDQPVPLR